MPPSIIFSLFFYIQWFPMQRTDNVNNKKWYFHAWACICGLNDATVASATNRHPVGRFWIMLGYSGRYYALEPWQPIATQCGQFQILLGSIGWCFTLEPLRSQGRTPLFSISIPPCHPTWSILDPTLFLRSILHARTSMTNRHLMQSISNLAWFYWSILCTQTTVVTRGNTSPKCHSPSLSPSMVDFKSCLVP